jgi:hypothetical protein
VLLQQAWAAPHKTKPFHKITFVLLRGIKNIPQSFLPLPLDHGLHFDGKNAKRLIIVQILDWNNGSIVWNKGDAYSVLVLAKDHVTYIWIFGDLAKKGTQASFEEKAVNKASDDDIQRATTFLDGCIKVVASTLIFQDGILEDSVSEAKKLVDMGFPNSPNAYRTRQVMRFRFWSVAAPRI